MGNPHLVLARVVGFLKGYMQELGCLLGHGGLEIYVHRNGFLCLEELFQPIRQLMGLHGVSR